MVFPLGEFHENSRHLFHCHQAALIGYERCVLSIFVNHQSQVLLMIDHRSRNALQVHVFDI